MEDYSDLESRTTDALSELIPDNLHPARNSNAPERDRWRMYNTHTERYHEPGFATMHELLLHTARRQREERLAWVSGGAG